MNSKNLYRWLAALVLSGLIAGGGGGVNASPPASGIKPGVTTTQNGLIITWTAPELEIFTDREDKARFNMPGCEVLEQPGAPYLPVLNELITLPPGADPQVHIEIIQESTAPIPDELAIAPALEGVIRNPDVEVVGGGYKSIPAAPSLSFDPVEIEILGVMRGVNLARVTFYPVRPVQDELRITEFIQARIDYNAPNTRTYGATSPLDPLQASLAGKVINPSQLQPSTRAPSQPSLLMAPQASSQTVIIEIKKRGLYEITYQDLQSAGFPVNAVNVNNLSLYRSGAVPGDQLQDVAMSWQGNGDQTFENWESILFYAEPRLNRWTDTDTYLLKEGNKAGKRMVNRPANPSSLSLGRAFAELIEEKNVVYTPDCYCTSVPAGRGGDHWAWEEIKIPYDGSVSKSFDFSISNVDTTKAAKVTVWLIGSTDLLDDPDHRVQIYINNQKLSPDITWDGRQSIEQELSIPASALNAGTNTLKIRLPGIVPIEGIYLDAYKIEYPKADGLVTEPLFFTGEEINHSYRINYRNAGEHGFIPLDVTNPNNPLWLYGMNFQGDTVTLGDTQPDKQYAYYLSTLGDISSPANIRLQHQEAISEGNYIVISHHNFINSISPLVSLREQQGYTVSTIDVRTIFDKYGFGKPVPEAITVFLEDAYYNWSTPPLYVLLVGDGTSDPKDFFSGGFQTFIPPHLVDVDPIAGETASDNRFVTVDPPDDQEDILPDMLIGRLPVNSVGELNTVVSKIINYETNPPAGDWRKTITTVADDPDYPGKRINNFPQDAIDIDQDFIPDGYIVSKINYQAGSDPNATKSAIRDKWNSGTAMMVYIGHGAIKRWGKTSEGFWLSKDLDSLTNQPKGTFVFEMTCLTGKFQSFEDQSIDENALLLDGDGAVAVWGSTGLGVANGHMQLAEGFFDNLFNGFYSDLGLATQAGKPNLMKSNNNYKDLVDTYVLFGDPATRLQMPRYGSGNIALPLVFKQ